MFADGGKDISSHSVLYKFHEGFTNSVKRPLQMKDFL